MHLETNERTSGSCLADDQLPECYLTASIRGNPILWDRLQNSYYRIKTSHTRLKSVWKCRQPGCKARVHTNDVSNNIIHTKNEHIHEVTVPPPQDISKCDKDPETEQNTSNKTVQKTLEKISGEGLGGNLAANVEQRDHFLFVEKTEKDLKK